MTKNPRPRHAAPSRAARLTGRTMLSMVGAPLAMLVVAGPVGATEIEVGATLGLDGSAGVIDTDELDLPEMPDAAGLPAVDGVPGVESVPGLDSLPSVDSLLGLDGLPDPDGLPDAEELASMGEVTEEEAASEEAASPAVQAAMQLDLDDTDRVTGPGRAGLPSVADVFSTSDLLAGLF